jgi:hypothetical protein
MSGHGPDNGDVRFERKDVNERSTFWFGVWILVVMVVTAFVVKPFYDLLRGREIATQHPAAYVAPSDESALEPPSPRLQVTPVLDLAAFRGRENQVLDTYGWVDKERGVARIPVEEAMRLVAERGLPQFPAVAPGTNPSSGEGAR